MISKNRISDIRKLHLKKFRDLQGLFLVEGRKSVEMLLQSTFQVEEIFATEQSMSLNQSLLKDCQVTMASSQDMERISALNTSPDLLAVVRKPSVAPPMDNLHPILLLDRIADPGNLGTIIRTADWFGFRQIVCSPDCVDLYNPKTIQATMGSFCHVHVLYESLVDFIILQKNTNNRRVLGAFLGGESVNTFSFQKTDMIVIGSESNGISHSVEEAITHKITIPQVSDGNPTAESLNAAVAAAVIMHQAAVSLTR